MYGRGSVAPLFGEFRSDYSMLNTTGGIGLAAARWQDDRVVTQLDFEHGVAWTCGCWRVSFDYYALFWFNAVTTPEFVEAVQNDNYVDVGDTIAFNGLVARLQFNW